MSNKSYQAQWSFWVNLICHRKGCPAPTDSQLFRESEIKYMVRLFGWAPLKKFMYEYYIPKRSKIRHKIYATSVLAEQILRRVPNKGFPNTLRRVRGRLLKKLATSLNSLEFSLKSAKRAYYIKEIFIKTGLTKYLKAMQRAGLQWQI